MKQSVNVYLHQSSTKKDVGRLVSKDRNIYFEYDKNFLATGIELSPYKLPLKSGVHLCDDKVFDGLFGVFADSLPDGWGKLLLDRHLLSKGVEFSNITPLDRLCHIGKFGIGALSYEPKEGDTLHLSDTIVLDDIANSSTQILQGSSSDMIEELLAMEGSSGGARPKVMLQIDSQNNMIHGSQKLQKEYHHYMVKFPNSMDLTDTGKLEYIYSLMAKKAGINIPNTKLLQSSNNSYFAIERFDRDKFDNRYHIHSVAGLTHSDFRVPSLDYDDLLTLTFHLTKDMQQLKEIFRVATFNLLVHNRDDHAKNFSFMLQDNSWKLSPAYDLTYSFGPGGEHSTMYMGEGKNPTIQHLETLAKKHNIKNYKQIIEEVQNAVSYFEKYAVEFELSKESIKTLVQALKL